MMKGMILSLVVVLSAAPLALAQEQDDNVLTPTDVLEAAKVSLTAAFRISLGSAEVGDLDTTYKVEVDTESFDLFFEAGVGLGRGFEVVASVPYQIRGLMEGDDGFAEYEIESYNIGDLTLQGVYRLLKEEKESPQWVVYAIVVAPVGYWKEAEAKITYPPPWTFLNQEGEKGGTGEGIWRYGLGTAISKRFGLFEPYVGASFLFGGETERKDTEYDRPNVGQVFLGAEFHVSPEAAIDVRGEVQFRDDEVETDIPTGAESTEESHQTFILTAQLYARVAPHVTLVAGGGIITVRDHLLSEEAELELEGHFAFVLQVGLQLVLGP